MATLVAPSRVFHFDGVSYDFHNPNEYCRPLSSVFTAARLRRVHRRSQVLDIAEEQEARYVTFNIKPLETIHTVEVRMHGGTLKAGKILAWVSLWQQLLWAAAHREDVPEVPDAKVLRPDGDIVALAREWLPDARQTLQARFLEKLEARRREIESDLPPAVRAEGVWWKPVPS